MAAEACLWNSRRHIWATRPAAIGDRAALLDRYFAHRRADFPQADPSWEQLTGLILHPHGSAAGVDGLPYEVYHVAPPAG